MLYLASYAVLLFTIQLIIILSKAPSWWLLTLWGLLFFYVYAYRSRFYFPADHPHAWQRRRMVALWLVTLLFLAGTYCLLSYFVHKHERSPIATYIETERSPTLSSSEHVSSVIEKPVYITGMIQSPITIDGNRVSFTLSVHTINQHTLSQPEKIVVQYYAQREEEVDRYREVNRRDYWAGYLRLEEPSPARNPGAFDYRAYLSRHQISFLGRADDNAWQHQPNLTWIAVVFNMLDHQRANWLEQVERIFATEIAPLVQAMTIGYRDELSPELVELYQDLGIIHILAISGLHVGIIIWGLYRLLGLLPLTREKLYLILFLFLPLYIYLSGGQVSAARASLMGMVALIFLRFRWWKHALIGLYGVYVCMLLYNPYYIYQIGFQLSFAVTFGLITAYPTLERRITFLPSGLRQVIGIAFVAQLASLPIILVHFYQFSPLSLLLNMLIVPVYSLIFIPGAFLLTLLSFVQVEWITLFVHLYERILTYIHQGLYMVQDFPYAILFTGKPSLWWISIYIGAVCIFFVQLEKGRLKYAWLAIGLLLCSLLALFIYPYLDSKAQLIVLDVGQGEAILIELPYRKEVIMIDLGGSIPFPREEWAIPKEEFEVGKDIILPYLRYRGINSLDKVIMTHGHVDHYGGIQGLLGQIRIKQVLRSPAYPHSEFEQEWLVKIAEAGIPIHSLSEGDMWGAENYQFYVLFPEKQEGLRQVSNAHDLNLVIWSNIYNTAFVWTGDVEEDGESIILQKYPKLRAEIINIAHHGSRTSTSPNWLKQMQAKYALISVGRDNRYHHPHGEVLERLLAENIAIYRTDRHGGIRMTVSPDGVELTPTLQ